MSDAAAYSTAASSDIDAVKQYIKNELHVNTFKENEEISSDINWRPTLQITVNKYTTIGYEINDKVFPPVIAINRQKMVDANQPICAYSVCHEEEYLKNQREYKDLKKEGFGLLVIDDDGNVTEYENAISLAQFITKAKYDGLTKTIPPRIKQRIKAAFDAYNQNPVSGLAELTKIVEGLTFNAAAQLVSRNVLTYGASISLSNLLTKMIKEASAGPNAPLKGQLSAMGGFHSHVKQFRNPSHHEPKNKKQAKKILTDCEAGFTEGIRKISDFISAFKHYGITVKL